ncbi:helicase C-terminal domain-containing protein [Fimicolochytrium jonesii]|uniref:helicase C-terminal domain-containing protein n=1 Tax=Fimicolochytrium jonesii TaxID=1396493 RepID=UPI0022FED50A|nr:helicase C-terminal domain-containing protein [Fimicolochytrium jonesii]KAI8817649.1 helicase C-terminal domain-containing protein [Fimicolochytrium jonesii]
MPEYNLKGVTVRFPYAAYDCQLTLMAKIIESLQTSGNALIQSPTGTGKTMCLLASTLAWREAFMASRQLASALDDGGKPTNDPFRANLLSQLSSAVSGSERTERYDGEPPKIYYVSRTHSQLSQAVAELRKSEYRPRVCVLGSREQMCIHPEVSTVPNVARSAICKQKVQKKTCEYHLNVETSKFQSEHEILDIEEIVQFGQEHRACPYFLSRASQSQADIIFLPYNYLIDQTSRKSQNIDVKNSIIIFDEGHNLESSCGEATSFELTEGDLDACILEGRHCKDLVSLPAVGARDVSEEDFQILVDIIVKCKERIANLPLTKSNQLVLPGEYIYDLFASMDVTFETVGSVIRVIEAAVALMAQETKRRQMKTSLNQFATALKVVFRDGYGSRQGDLKDICREYKVFVQGDTSAGDDDGFQGRGAAGRKLSFWCFSSGVAMKDLVQRGCRSIILASGTLSPLESFACEMGIPFQSRLENPHVIEPDQVFVGIVQCGPAGVQLSSSYENRKSPAYITDLGNAIVNFVRIVPDGLLCFFPSYTVLKLCMEAWERPNQGASVSILDRIRKYKHTVTEPKAKAEFGQTLEEFYRHLNDPDLSGAVFFAVCRGKASEGLDFSDSKGRAVVVCGIPFPSHMDPKVKLKRQYLDEQHADKKTPQIQTLSGSDWYKQQAARAVNQALGRVIRHKNDYGAILLCDFRFRQNISQLPVWVRQHVRVHNNFGEVQGQLGRFFRHMDEKQGQTKVIAKKSADAKVAARGNAAVMEHKVFQSIVQTKTVVSLEHSQVEIKTKRARSATKESSEMWQQLKGINSLTTVERMGGESASSSKTTMEITRTTAYKSVPTSLMRSSSTVLRKPLHPHLSAKARQASVQEVQDDDGLKSVPVDAQSARKRPLSADDEGQPFHNQATDSISIENQQPSSSRRSNTKAYIQKVKAALSVAHFSDFQHGLKSFKSGDIDISKLVDSLLLLFKGDEDLIWGLSDFIPRKHRGLFEERVRRHQTTDS